MNQRHRVLLINDGQPTTKTLQSPTKENISTSSVITLQNNYHIPLNTALRSDIRVTDLHSIKMDERWQSLPPELHHNIIDQSGRQTMLNWSKTCHVNWQYTQPEVWKRLRLKYGPQEDGGVPDLGFETAPPPGIIPRHITIDTRGPNTQLTLDTVARAPNPIKPIMERWPNIISITHEGAIPVVVFANILTIKDLETLELRTGTLCNPPPPHEDRDQLQMPNQLGSWRNLNLNFGPLGELQFLRRLKINQLIYIEARGLGMAVRDMNHLESLEVSAIDWLSPWTIHNYRQRPPERIHSPMLCFISSVALRHGSFPVSLENLTLRDTFHEEDNFQLLLRTNFELVDITKDCTDLQRLEIEMPRMAHLEVSIQPLKEMVKKQKESGAKPKSSRNLPDLRKHMEDVRADLLKQWGG